MNLLHVQVHRVRFIRRFVAEHVASRPHGRVTHLRRGPVVRQRSEVDEIIQLVWAWYQHVVLLTRFHLLCPQVPIISEAERVPKIDLEVPRVRSSLILLEHLIGWARDARCIEGCICLAVSCGHVQ